MADDDQQPPPQRYWFPYWTSPPATAPRPALRPQPSRRDTRPAPPQPAPPVTASPSRRPQPAQPAATAALRGAGGAGRPQAQPQPTRLSSRPSPSRAHPLSPIREPNSSAAPASAPRETKPPQVKPASTPPQPAAHPAKESDIVVPQEKIIHEPPSDTKTQSKAVEKEKEKEHKERDKEKEHKEEKDKKEHKEKEKHKEEKDKKEHNDNKEKKHKEKEEKEKEHKEKKEKDKHKEERDESKLHGGKLHKELKAGVTDMVHKVGATASPSTGQHECHASSGAGTTVITLAGENKGASMTVSHADQAENKERRACGKLDDCKQQHDGARGLTAFVNSNVQVVNNSLVLQSSCSSNDPGVHLKLSAKSKKKGDGEEDGGKGGVAAVPKKK